MEFLSIILRLIAAWGRVGFVLLGERGDRGAPGGAGGDDHGKLAGSYNTKCARYSTYFRKTLQMI